MKSFRHIGLILICCTVVLVPGCTTFQPGSGDLNADQITSLGNRCAELFTKHIAAWDSRQPDNLRQVYADEIVHFDGEPIFFGIDPVVAMAADMFRFFPDWQMQAGETFISREECFGTWINWGVFGFRQDDPGKEYDLLASRNGKVYYWRLYYDQKFHNAFASYYRIKQDFLKNFASAWSIGSADQLVGLYAEDAILEDSLHGVNLIGASAIRDYAIDFFNRHPEASWTLLDSFAEDRSVNFSEQFPHPAQGGIYAINGQDDQGEPCEVRAALILVPDENEHILAQKIYYAADTLIACGWAE